MPPSAYEIITRDRMPTLIILLVLPVACTTPNDAASHSPFESGSHARQNPNQQRQTLARAAGVRADPDTEKVERHRVFCRVCRKWISLDTRYSEFERSRWIRHKKQQSHLMMSKKKKTTGEAKFQHVALFISPSVVRTASEPTPLSTVKCDTVAKFIETLLGTDSHFSDYEMEIAAFLLEELIENGALKLECAHH
ncbi:hypothetical protein D9619_006895 [Psilocybe cf. subviscida]|uniref:Uncharacterized protein n=1 Tax=Psilocybe cf. subviscida TaxID=2480587 RepID=A0A8H5B4H9_9AGAR|nr:hypothetical protein D9619_006895 [Psilocybe cf. subviscida]